MVPRANPPPTTVDIAHTQALDARTRALDDALARERPAGMNSSLKVCTWNAQMLPGVFAGQGGTKTDIAKRAHAMANNILCCSRADAIDVVCLQEMWEVEAAKALKVALREEFPFVYAPSARCGLMVASKFSMVCNHFTALPAKGVERLAFTKGVSTSFLRLTCGGGRDDASRHRAQHAPAVRLLVIRARHAREADLVHQGRGASRGDGMRG